MIQNYSGYSEAEKYNPFSRQKTINREKHQVKKILEFADKNFKAVIITQLKDGKENMLIMKKRKL